MAAADPPAGLMDIASSMSRDEIPMKLRCAICNSLAVNAFRLPCCDQSICESCQTSLPDTCPVCAHTPVSPDLCKPNKALRTTLKAYLRTEEKKREKERQAAAPPTPTIPTPVESVNTPTDPTTGSAIVESAPQVGETDTPVPQEPAGDHATESLLVQSENTEHVGDANGLESQQATDKTHESPDDQDIPPADTMDADTDAPVPEDSTNTDGTAPNASAPSTQQEGTEPGDSDVTNTNASGFPGMGWNNTGGTGGMNGTNAFMPNSMFPFSNPMGMPGAMNPMAANQGMFGDYGMNMTGMGMNMGMNYNGQGMYGSLGWDNSQQNMWQGDQGQDKFNPNAFANGSGPPYGGAFGGSNMSYPNNPAYQSGYYGSGYGHGGFRGRGRGYYHGASGRGGFGGHGQGHSAPFTNSGVPDRLPASETPLDDSNEVTGGEDPQAIKGGSTEPAADANTNPTDMNANAEAPSAENDTQQLQGIPTIDSLDESMLSGRGDYGGNMGMGYRRGYMREPQFWGNPGMQPHLEASNPGVEGAPAAPRAMREGLPNTSVLRQRGFHQGNPSAGNNMPVTAQSSNPDTPQDSAATNSPSQGPSQPQPPRRRSWSRSPSPPRPESVDNIPKPNNSAQNQGRKKRSKPVKTSNTERRSFSPMGPGSDAFRDRDRDFDRERDREPEPERERRSTHRSHRSRRRSRSRSRSTARKGDSRPDRLSPIPEDRGGRTKEKPKINPSELAARIGHSHRTSRDRPGRQKDDRDRDRSGRDRNKDRKRSRRDRSESANGSEYSTNPRSRRVKTHHDDPPQASEAPPAAVEEKDPHTLEREARNRERLLREKERREKAKSGQRRGSRQERMVGGRLISCKYEDEL
ncbi:hypothetical protein N7493_012040 [Penicillium malachiteum]|uniref:RING-type domain-containing protein n=1 Tax=Penicillium malachiteum TaxID=1324776 RepID=A0AAD6MPY9_9EURO|nr:hypothetical protein N7493_012040 [Penicillium malachiteum]